MFFLSLVSFYILFGKRTVKLFMISQLTTGEIISIILINYLFHNFFKKNTYQ